MRGSALEIINTLSRNRDKRFPRKESGRAVFRWSNNKLNLDSSLPVHICYIEELDRDEPLPRRTRHNDSTHPVFRPSLYHTDQETRQRTSRSAGTRERRFEIIHGRASVPQTPFAFCLCPSIDIDPNAMTTGISED
jgi:hypothetical protein